ncbi:MAG: 3'-5' exonuclease [Candidatus Methanoperedens sp.]|nr:3'-5' exonuclease [Candidatus Methanoperedens sp.]
MIEANISYLIFDTETTGLPKNWKAPVTDLNNWPRLVQIAWMQCDISGNILSSSNYIVKPLDFIIPERAVKIHGISTEMAKNEGVALNTVLNEFSTAISRSSFLIAHNMAFDVNIVGAEFLREKIESRLFSIPKICTMEMSTDHCRIPGSYGYKWPSLSELYFTLFDKDFEEAHDAVVDVKACAECFFRLKKEGVLK